MTTAGDARARFAELEARILEIEAGLLGVTLPDRTGPLQRPGPDRRRRSGAWGLTTLLAICGSAAVTAPFILILAS